MGATYYICLYGLKQGLESLCFRPTTNVFIIDVLANKGKFLERFGYCTVLICDFTFNTTKDFGCFINLISQFKLKFRIMLQYMFIWVAFWSHTEWSNAQSARAPTTTILPNTAGTWNGYSFCHVIYTPQLASTKILQNLLYVCAEVCGFLLH